MRHAKWVLSTWRCCSAATRGTHTYRIGALSGPGEGVRSGSVSAVFYPD